MCTRSDVLLPPTDLASALRTIELLLERVAQHETRLREVEAERDQLARELAAERQEKAALVRRFFGQKSERLASSEQRLLFAGTPPAEQPASAPPAEHDVRGHRRRRSRPHPGRGGYPADLPRVEERVPTPPAQLVCPCGAHRRQAGTVRSERLDVVPAQFRILELVRDKLVCDHCGQVASPPLPPEPIRRGLPTARLLAHVLVSKYGDHLPLARQEAIYARQGVRLSRATMSGWCLETAWSLVPVIVLVMDEVLAGPLAQTDETGLPVLARQACRKERLWIVRGVERGDVVFVHTRTKHKEQPLGILRGFRGYLQADAYHGFNALYESGEVIEVGCWAHTRRYFFEAAELQPGSPEARWALEKIGEIYAVERELKERAAEEARPLDPGERLAARQARSSPLVDELFAWALEQRARALPKSPLGKALGYLRNQEAALRRFLEDGRLEVDNNASERGLRQAVTGRKNYLFAGSEAGATAAAIHYSVVVACKELGIDPLEYYADVLPRLATRLTRDELLALTPRNWAAARRRERPPPAPTRQGGSKAPSQTGSSGPTRQTG
jgi:transposase